MSISSAGPIRIEMPALRCPFEGISLSRALSTCEGMVVEDFAANDQSCEWGEVDKGEIRLRL
jgi:hypothetical protein